MAKTFTKTSTNHYTAKASNGVTLGTLDTSTSKITTPNGVDTGGVVYSKRKIKRQTGDTTPI